MRNYFIIAAFASVIVLNCSTSAFAASFNCNQATRVQDKFICQNEEISRLDEAMAKAFREQIKKLPQESQFFVLSSQRSWLAYWPWQCSALPNTLKFEASANSCVADLYRERLQELNVPSLVTGRSSYTVSERRFLPPKNADESAAAHVISFPQINVKLSGDVAINSWLARDLNQWREGLDVDSDTDLSVTLISYHESLAQATEVLKFYGHGAAHPIQNKVHLYFLPTVGRTMQANDFFIDNRWVNVVANYVFKRLQLRLGDNLQIKMSKDLYPMINQVASWSIDNNSFALAFNQYEVAPYSEGIVEIKVPLSVIQPYLTPFGRKWFGFPA